MADRHRWLLWSVRYGIPLAFFLLGLAALIFAAPIQKAEGCGSCWGAGLTVLALNVMLRWSFAEQAERQAEEDTRNFMTEHGYWPDEQPRVAPAPKAASVRPTRPRRPVHRSSTVSRHRR